MPLSWRGVGTYQEKSSHATHQGTLGHSRLSSLSHRGLILAREKKATTTMQISVCVHMRTCVCV